MVVLFNSVVVFMLCDLLGVWWFMRCVGYLLVVALVCRVVRIDVLFGCD